MLRIKDTPAFKTAAPANRDARTLQTRFLVTQGLMTWRRARELRRGDRDAPGRAWPEPISTQEIQPR